MLKRRILLSVAVLMLFVSVTWGGEISWTFQDTSIGYMGPVALGMRDGHVWPVVFSGGPIAALYPTGWQVVGENLLLGPNVKAASSPTGEVAAVNPGNGIVSGSAGWEFITAEAVAFDGAGRLWTANRFGGGWVEVSFRDGGRWHSLPAVQQPSNGSLSLAVGTHGEVGLAVSSGGGFDYYHYSSLTGGWTATQNSISQIPIDNVTGLAFDAHNIPHIVGVGAGAAVAYDFDVRTGSWQGSILSASMGLSPDTFMPIAASEEAIGTAFAMNDNLYYSRNEDSNGWTTSVLPRNPMLPSAASDSVGFGYDYQGLPLIAYTAGGNMWLAYDPISIPEPATMGLLALSGMALIRRRHAA